MSWAIVIWTALFILWGVAGAGALSDRCDGMTGDALNSCQAGTAVGGTIGLSLIFGLWFVGFIVLAIIWFATRPKANVTVYGPGGEQVLLSEKDAKKRVEKNGWSYRPQS